MTDPIDNLIEDLARDLAPAHSAAARRRIAVLTGAGLAVSVAFVLVAFGPRADLSAALLGPTFWMKLGFMAALAALAAPLALRLATPGRAAGPWPAALAATAGALAVIGAAQLALAPPEARMTVWLGGSFPGCLWKILAAASPILAGGFWAARRLAPTRLRAAGAAIGLMAGAAGAAAYSLSCGETSMTFVASWYVLGAALTAALGWALGPRILRW